MEDTHAYNMRGPALPRVHALPLLSSDIINALPEDQLPWSLIILYASLHCHWGPVEPEQMPLSKLGEGGGRGVED